MTRFKFNPTFLTIVFLFYTSYVINAQSDIFDYGKPKEYQIAGIQVSGVKFLDQKVLADLSGLRIGDVIVLPGDQVSKAIKKYWNQGLFDDVNIYADSIVKDKIYLNIYLKERPRLSDIRIKGVKRSEEKDIQEKLELKKGSQITDNVINTIKVIVTKYFIEKGYYNISVSFDRQEDPAVTNKVILTVKINKNEKVKIADVLIDGNSNYSEVKLQHAMKGTKEKKFRYFLRSAKFNPDKFKEDKGKLIEFYNKNGYRDAKILADSVVLINPKRLQVKLKVKEGIRYFYRDIKWTGNTKYTTDVLEKYLGIKKGDVYDQKLMEKRLYQDEDAVSSLYLDNGYLFSSIDPIEIQIENDSIDIEMRIFEGKQASFNDINILGNNKTNEHVIRREIRTKPGDLFSKSNIVRSVRELAQLGHFDPEQIEPNPLPNQLDGTVDLNYNLVEKSTDQLELSGGWGAGMLIATVGLSFNNFSARNMFNGKAWRPVPSGDGQKLNLRAQTNGKYYQAYSISFMEPWFGGKKPNSLSVSFYHTIRNAGSWWTQESNSWMKITGVSLGLGRRMKWPDDYFTMYNELSFQRYGLNEWTGYFLYADGNSNNVSFTTTFGRNSVDQPIYPRSGSNISLTIQATPPFSLMNGKDYTTMSISDKYKWIEYHKWKFKMQQNWKLVGNFVLHAKAEFGYLAFYNKKVGPSPFENFDVGGSGLSNFSIYGIETVAMRGYEDGSLTPYVNGSRAGNIYDKYTFEFRYPFLLKTAATVYGLTFFEGGNAWYDWSSFNPYDFKRSVGFGVRAFLPMFGLIGLDWGYGLDEIEYSPGSNKGNFHLLFGQQF